MRAETAAAYTDEKSVEAFRRRVGTLYPQGVNIDGRGEIWLREALDAAISKLDRTTGAAARVSDVADLL
jgi:streptogramin lyase